MLGLVMRNSGINGKVLRGLAPCPDTAADFLVHLAMGLQPALRNTLQQVGRHPGVPLPVRLDAPGALGGYAHPQGVEMQP